MFSKCNLEMEIECIKTLVRVEYEESEQHLKRIGKSRWHKRYDRE